MEIFATKITTQKQMITYKTTYLEIINVQQSVTTKRQTKNNYL